MRKYIYIAVCLAHIPIFPTYFNVVTTACCTTSEKSKLEHAVFQLLSELNQMHDGVAVQPIVYYHFNSMTGHCGRQ